MSKFRPLLLIMAVMCRPTLAMADDAPYLLVLGMAQDGGVPQIGHPEHPAWNDPARRRLASSLGLVDPSTGQRWLFDCTPDVREQILRLDLAAPNSRGPLVDGVFLTHAHIGHYTGLMFFGHESAGARNIAVFALPRMAAFLTDNGPWSQLVDYQNIRLEVMDESREVVLSEGLSVTAQRVPHRQEFSEVAAFRIQGPNRSALYLPDIDGWAEWDAAGVRLEDQLANVDLAFLDATFYADGEVPGRDMSGFPHPRMTDTMNRLSGLPDIERAKVLFIHLNHTNPVLDPESAAARAVQDAGFRVAWEGLREAL